MHEVLVNRLGGLSLPRKSVVRLTDRPNMTLDVYRGRKSTNQQPNNMLHDTNMLAATRLIVQTIPTCAKIAEDTCKPPSKALILFIFSLPKFQEPQ